MPDLSAIRRPRNLLMAAVRGLTHYRRARDLPPLVGDAPDALAALVQAEGDADAARRAGRQDYRVKRHLELLIALLAEARDRAPDSRAA
jgi:hypothetical protein